MDRDMHKVINLVKAGIQGHCDIINIKYTDKPDCIQSNSM